MSNINYTIGWNGSCISNRASVQEHSLARNDVKTRWDSSGGWEVFSGQTSVPAIHTHSPIVYRRVEESDRHRDACFLRAGREK